MSYQSFLESVNRAEQSNPRSRSPQASPIPRKPTATSVAAPSTSISSRQPSITAPLPPQIASNNASSAISAPHNVRKSVGKSEIDAALRICLTLQKTAVNEHNKRPFAALLLAPDTTTVLLSHFSISHVQHAESELARLASLHFSTTYLGMCTLVSTWEPCAMCAGTIYWSGIGRVIYGASETKLQELTGAGNDEHMTMALPCRQVFAAGQRDIEIHGPIEPFDTELVQESKKWWDTHQVNSVLGNDRSLSGKASDPSLRSTSVKTWNEHDTALGSVNEDGEYKADLQIDWM